MEFQLARHVAPVAVGPVPAATAVLAVAAEQEKDYVMTTGKEEVDERRIGRLPGFAGSDLACLLSQRQGGDRWRRFKPKDTKLVRTRRRRTGDEELEPQSTIPGRPHPQTKYNCGWIGLRGCVSEGAMLLPGGNQGHHWPKQRPRRMQKHRGRDTQLVGAAASRSTGGPIQSERCWQPQRVQARARRTISALHAPLVMLLMLLCISVGLGLLTSLPTGRAMRVFRSWTEKHWCESVEDPEWPFAYTKYADQQFERKGRVSTNLQDMRHECGPRGVASKCHRCEDTICGESLNSICSMQLQGVSFLNMSTNLATAADTPWAVNGAYRNDFGGENTSHVCVFLSGEQCATPIATDYSNCSVRCWGFNQSSMSPLLHLEALSYVQGEDNDQAKDRWEYPKNASELGLSTREFNPQGYVDTHAGSGHRGLVDGLAADARFNEPQDVAVDADGIVYVADSGNNAIRMIHPNGTVSTIVGHKGEAGYEDGPAENATLARPSGVDLYYDWSSGSRQLVLFVADTDNHRIRKITGVNNPDEPDIVSCYAGLCGNGTESFTLTKKRAEPKPGYADGSPDLSRFDSPKGIAVMADGTVVVSDTNNHLIRLIVANNSGVLDQFNDRLVLTLAGNVGVAEVNSDGEPLEGCLPPCLKGNPGYRDGNLTYAQFQYPNDVAIGPDGKTVVVVDQNRVRRVTFPNVTAFIQGISTEGYVITMAGGRYQGERDGAQDEAEFNHPDGVVVTADGVTFVVDSVSCRLRRLSSAMQVAKNVSCNTTLTELVRPSGCNSYDYSFDELDKMLSPFQGNMYYRYRDRAKSSPVYGHDVLGRTLEACVGTPPIDELDKHFLLVEGDNLVIDDDQVDISEDTADGTLIKIRCPPVDQCMAGTGPGGMNANLRGTDIYDASSSVCQAAIHAGYLRDNSTGLLHITLERGILARNANYSTGSTRNGLVSGNLQYHSSRLFSVQPYDLATVETHTVAGKAFADLEVACGYRDGQPPLESEFTGPSGVGAYVNSTLSNSTLLYIADTAGHRVRSVSAVCTLMCENGGICVGNDVCECAEGWTGPDCTSPVCTSECPDRHVCVAPDTCDCIPGFIGENCTDPLCMQDCENGGVCTAPDTCTCAPGWFDPNCTTPICVDTCGNGGNCTAPNTCRCPEDWTGPGCRIPVCQQDCKNGGYCVAPDTCLCPPQYSGYDCAEPVCHQGFFEEWDEDRFPPILADREPNTVFSWMKYTPCDLEDWCNDTNTFSCLQSGLESFPVEIPSGPEWRHKTGRSTRPAACSLVEVLPNVTTHFQYQDSDNESTDYWRYTPITTYEPFPTNASRNPWSPFEEPTAGHTLPFSWGYDRQVAMVEWRNVSQGRYRCANGGNCTAPDVCRCDEGWIGFDCRTPVCSSGYYNASQEEYIRNSEHPKEISVFFPFMYQFPEVLAFDAGVVNGTNSTAANATDANATNAGDGGAACNSTLNGTHCSQNVSLSFLEQLDRRYKTVINQELGFNLSDFYLNSTIPYTNPDFTIQFEELVNNGTAVKREEIEILGVPYLPGIAAGTRPQGGYRCSIRGYTALENRHNVTDHPNFFSQWMDAEVQRDGYTYVFWEDMDWPVLHRKSDPLFAEAPNKNTTFIYTDEGYRLNGVWNRTKQIWVEGKCIMEFERVCEEGAEHKGVDLISRRTGVFVQDTDRSFRPRISYTDKRVQSDGEWFQDGGQCVDHVKRGCFNNGTCVAPDECECAEGWSGDACSEPICEFGCSHNGMCSAPGICTCERGWEGPTCDIPMCAQECQNNGTCVAPDTCQCYQWENEFRDGREGGGRPLFQDPHGNPQLTGWTGFDCSTPICVQASAFKFMAIWNVDAMDDNEENPSSYEFFGGHGPDGTLECDNVRCPEYDEKVTSNDGRSFQSGCGWDPLESGCCTMDPNEEASFTCVRCADHARLYVDNTFVCKNRALTQANGTLADILDLNTDFFWTDPEGNTYLKMCGRDHSPAQYYEDKDPRHSSYNFMSNRTSDQFLCNIGNWTQGDYIDDAGLGRDASAGTNLPFDHGRHIRINYPNITAKVEIVQDVSVVTWVQSAANQTGRGEGLYVCDNGGSCLGPDRCSCADGYEGFDCSKALCRHLQPDGTVSTCQNGGICEDRDDCDCIQDYSVLWNVHDEAPRALTGWTGSDCTMPVCSQGFYDPFCTDLPQAPGGEGCYRCANGGNCTSPDQCTCADGWTGYDCKTPVCEVVADALTREQLATVDEEKIHQFETDPCSMEEIHGTELWDGEEVLRGTCQAPNECTCFCKLGYNPHMCHADDLRCRGPWQDPMVRVRTVLSFGVIFGTRDCYDGYEGILDGADRYTTCHLSIVVPSYLERYSIEFIAIFSTLFLVASTTYTVVRRRLKRKYLLAKIERRRSRRSSEDSLTDPAGRTNRASTQSF